MPSTSRDRADPGGPLVVLGAGYAGLSLAQTVWHRSRGKLPVVLVDRHPVHVLRTELYEIGEIAAAADAARWAVPLAEVLDRTSIEYRQGTVQRIDFASRTVRTEAGDLPYRFLALCLGNVGAYYGVPGAAEHTQQVYGLLGAQRLARAIREMEVRSAELRGERRPRIVVIGGGSTGTELAADIATTDWRGVTTRSARAPEVVLVTGALPFLAGLSPRLVSRAQKLLRDSGVSVFAGLNTTRVEPDRVTLEDGTVLVCDIAIWCAGVEAPQLIRALPLTHGKGGRLSVEPTLELPGLPGVFAVGDVAEVKDPKTGMFVPQTAQAAIAEARAAAENVLARWGGSAPKPFVYRERGIILSMGRTRGAASFGSVTVAGRSASWLKKLVEREYVRAVNRGEPSNLL